MWRRFAVALMAISLLAGCSGKSSDPSCVGKIKGNINDKGERIYHLPKQRFYGATKPEKWFCTEDDARKAGFRRSKV